MLGTRLAGLPAIISCREPVQSVFQLKHRVQPPAKAEVLLLNVSFGVNERKLVCLQPSAAFRLMG